MKQGGLVGRVAVLWAQWHKHGSGMNVERAAEIKLGNRKGAHHC